MRSLIKLPVVTGRNGESYVEGNKHVLIMLRCYAYYCAICDEVKDGFEGQYLNIAPGSVSRCHSSTSGSGPPL